MRVKYYGGPMHGQVHELIPGTRRVDCVDNRFNADQYSRYHPTPIPIKPSFQTRSYEVNKYQERRGNMWRMMNVAVIEGQKNLLPHEEWEIRRDLDKVPWSAYRMPSILYEFDRWFNLTVYLKTGDESYIREEFHQI